MKIKVKSINNSGRELDILAKGDWIDLYTPKTVAIPGPTVMFQKVIFSTCLIPLGIAMELPKYMEANILPRSSTFLKHRIMLSNSMGIIDHTYCGDKDEWKFSAVAFDNVTIPEGTRIAQFRIRPSQFAPFRVKLKWLFTNKIKFVYVDHLGNEDRGGFGSSGN